MAYELHIEKEGENIEIAAWLSAVKETEDATLDGNPQIAKNPNTGEIIKMGGSTNNVAVRLVESKMFGFKKQEKWVTCIFFRDGRPSFNATKDIGSSVNPVRIVAASLAKLLGAKIVGDEGEIYDW